jgi:hypothetical protein
MGDPHLIEVILGRSDRRSLSERNLQHRSAECLIRDKDRPAPDLHCRPDTMRIFERLRGRSRSDSAIERKLFEAITDVLLRKFEDETSIPVLTESKANCCSCCSAEDGASH